MYDLNSPLGSESNPVVIKTYSDDRLNKLLKMCEENQLHFIIGLDDEEDITDLERALKERAAPNDVYDMCPCGSGSKYKFCCLKKPIELDI